VHAALLGRVKAVEEQRHTAGLTDIGE